MIFGRTSWAAVAVIARIVGWPRLSIVGPIWRLVGPEIVPPFADTVRPLDAKLQRSTIRNIFLPWARCRQPFQPRIFLTPRLVDGKLLLSHKLVVLHILQMNVEVCPSFEEGMGQ
jgi:hypothetical protein